MSDWVKKQRERDKKRNRAGKPMGSSKWLYLLALVVGLGLPLIALGAYFFQNYATKSALEISGNTITVRRGGDFQAALNRAQAGDTILLEAGATFKGNFVLPNKAGREFIIIRTSAANTEIPPGDTRLDPQKYARVLPKLVSPNQEPVISTTTGAHHFRFIGIEFGGTDKGVGNIIKIGTTEEKSIEEIPHHIELDRVFIHATAPEGQRRGVAANGKFIKIINSHISDIKRKGEESQAIAAWATDGPLEIINNYMEAAAETILLGGADSNLKLVPTDCLIRDNWMNKPLNWREEGWDVKNLLEIKFGRRITIENNLMTNNWAKAQDGTAILFSTRADIGNAATIEDIVFANNIVRGSGNGLNIYGPEGSRGHRLTIRNNIFDDINAKKWSGAGFFMKTSAWDGLVIENNTIIQTGSIANAYDEPSRGFIFRNNIIFENEYGFKGDSTGSGNSTIEKYYPQSDISFNAIIGGKASLYRGKNIYPNNIGQIGFVNFEEKDFRLRADSPLLKRGFQGKQIGADLDPKRVGGTQ